MNYDVNSSSLTHDDEEPVSGSRRGFLKLAALTGAVVSTTGHRALAQGDIGFFAKDLSDEKLLHMYRTILRIRWHERTQADQMLTNEDYRGYNHFYAGQEAVATGVCSALRNDGPFDQIDMVYSSHRPSGHAIAKGVDIPKMVAEMDFRATGLNNGYGAEMHISDPSVGFVGADGMIGPGHVTATGSAFSFRARGSDQVSVVLRRRRHLRHAAVPFGAQQRQAAGSAIHLRAGEQPLSPVRALLLFLPAPGHRRGGGRLRHSRRGGGRAGRDPGLQRRQARQWSVPVRAAARPSSRPRPIATTTTGGLPGAKAGELGAFGYDPLAITSFRPEREVRAWMQRDPVDICAQDPGGLGRGRRGRAPRSRTRSRPRSRRPSNGP